MAQAKIRWTIRAAGRDEGHEEIVEIDTPFMQGCLANLRIEIIQEIQDVQLPTPEEVMADTLTAPKPARKWADVKAARTP